MDLERADIRLVHRQILALGERDPVELVRGEEHAVVEHAVELEVRLYLGVIELVLRRAHLLRIEVPVPRLELERRGVARLRARVDLLLDLCSFLLRLRRRRGREVAEDLVDRLGRARRLFDQRVGREVRIAEQLSLGRAELEDPHLDLGVVRIAATRTTDRRLEQALAQRAILELLEHRLPRRVLQRSWIHLPKSGRAPWPLLPRRRAAPGDNPSSCSTRSTATAPALVASSTFLAKLGGQRRQLAVERLERGLVGLGQPRAGAARTCPRSDRAASGRFGIEA